MLVSPMVKSARGRYSSGADWGLSGTSQRKWGKSGAGMAEWRWFGYFLLQLGPRHTDGCEYFFPRGVRTGLGTGHREGCGKGEERRRGE